MSTERRLLLALALCVLAITGIEFLLPTPPSGPPAKPPGPAKVEAPGTAAAPAPAPAPGNGGPGAPPGPAAGIPDSPIPSPGGPVKPPEPPESPDQPFRSGRIRALLHSRGASVGRTWLEGIPAHPGSDAAKEAGALEFLNEMAEDHPGALAATLASGSIELVDLEMRQWELVSRPGETPVVYRARAMKLEREEGKGIVVEKRFLPAADPGAWHFRMELTVWNEDEDLHGRHLDLRVRGSALVHAPEGARDFLYGRVKVRNTASPKEFTGPAALAGIRDREPKVVDGDLDWVATASTYFALVLDPDDPDDGQAAPHLQARMEAFTPRPTERDPRPVPQPSPVLSVPVGAGKPGAKTTVGFTVFVGPTVNEARIGGEYRPVLSLEDYAGYKPVRNPGWFDLIGQGLFYVLQGFHALVRNWGVAIVLLTVLVRGLLFPLSKRQMKSTIEYSRKLQKIKPKLDALKEKHADDRQKFTQEQMRLFKENQVPLMPGGCLLTFLQLPIWIALYGMLQSNYDLRHAPFLWIADLSQPEHISGAPLMPFIEHVPLVPNSFMYLNVLPLFMVATWFFASKATMTPPADEQQAQMQRMMQWMPFVMLLFPGFYDMPAGLCLYITASSTWGIVESRIIRRSLGAT